MEVIANFVLGGFNRSNHVHTVLAIDIARKSYRTLIAALLLQVFALEIANAQVELEKSAAEIEALDRSLGELYTQRLRNRYAGSALTNVSAVTPETLASDATLVIEGRVKSVSYTHEGPYEQPFTVNQIEITRVLKGAFAEEIVVIKQPGGPSKNGELINIVSHAEYFSPGDGELLFLEVSGDQVSIKNRFRVHEDALYSQDGFGLMLSGSGELTLGKARNPAETFSTIVIGSEVLRKNFSQSQQDHGDLSGHSLSTIISDSAKSTQLTVDKFAEVIRDQ